MIMLRARQARGKVRQPNLRNADGVTPSIAIRLSRRGEWAEG